MKKTSILISALAGAILCSAQNVAVLRADKPGAAIPSTMYGIFFEDINYNTSVIF